MYDNIGRKIKDLARTVFYIVTFLSLCMAIGNILSDPGVISIFLSIALIIFVPLAAWISSWVLYGFGELIEKVCVIARNTSDS